MIESENISDANKKLVKAWLVGFKIVIDTLEEELEDAELSEWIKDWFRTCVVAGLINGLVAEIQKRDREHNNKIKRKRRFFDL
jgi:hypothetical protein